tara:strand:+ start:3467 stop:5116 length:1650 start_codon:yes stop_codon:yes gene_type:complete
MKFINSFNILKSDLQKTKSTRRFSINGKAGAAFDLKVTNEGGKFYNFITQTFETNETISTTSVVSNDIEGSTVYINAENANIKLGMTVTGNGVSSVVTVVQINSQTLILSDSVGVSAGTTLTFTAEANLKNQKINKSGSYVNNIVFPTVTSNDIYTVLLEASIANDTELKTTENIVYDTDINSATYGQDITHEFTNKLFKSITINQYIDTTITINASSPALDALGVDYSSNSFTIVKPRNFQDLQGFKTSFTFTFTTTSVSAIVKSKDFEAKYFETVKTQTVNGAVSSSRTVVMDSVDNIIVGMKATGTGLSAAADKVIYIDALNKEITLNNARSIGDGVTITFTAEGSQGPSAYGTQLSFVNLKSTLTPLTVTVASASSSSTALALEDASFVSEGSSTIISGVGINVDETNVNVASRPSGDLEFTEGGGAYNNDPTITHTADARIVAGLAVSGSGIPAGATIASITDTTHFELSVATTGGNKTGETLTFNSNNIVLSSARSLEAGQKLNIEGSSSAITLTGDVFLKSIGDTNFTSTLQIDDFVGIGVS